MTSQSALPARTPPSNNNCLLEEAQHKLVGMIKIISFPLNRCSVCDKKEATRFNDCRVEAINEDNKVGVSVKNHRGEKIYTLYLTENDIVNEPTCKESALFRAVDVIRTTDGYIDNLYMTKNACHTCNESKNEALEYAEEHKFKLVTKPEEEVWKISMMFDDAYIAKYLQVQPTKTISPSIINILHKRKGSYSFPLSQCFRCGRQVIEDFSDGCIGNIEHNTALFTGSDGRRIGIRVGNSTHYTTSVQHMIRVSEESILSMDANGGGVMVNELMKEELCAGCEQAIDAKKTQENAVRKERTDVEDDQKEEPTKLEPREWVQKQKLDRERLEHEPNTPENQARKRVLDERFEISDKWEKLNADMEADRARLKAEFSRPGSNKELIRDKMKKLRTTRTTERAKLLKQWNHNVAMDTNLFASVEGYNKKRKGCTCPMCPAGNAADTC